MESAVERGAPPPVKDLVVPAGLPSDLLLRRPDLREAEQQLIAANARIGAARAQYFPSLGLTGYLGSESTTFSKLFTGPAATFLFAANVTQPIWNAGRISAGVDVSEAVRDQALANYRKAVANAFKDVRDALAAQGAARETLEAETVRAGALEKALKQARLRFDAGIASLAANVTVFTLVSLFSRSSAEEQSAADACTVDNVRRPQRRELLANSPQEFAAQLSKPLGAITAQREVEQALQDLQLPFDERRPYALRRLRDRLEANLSGLMGPSVAQDMIETFLPYKSGSESYVSEDIHFIESRLEDYQSRLTGLAAELDSLRRYHRQTLQELPMGVCSLAKDQEILMWNRALEQLTGISAQRVVGSRLGSLEAPWRNLLEEFSRQSEPHRHKQRLSVDGQARWLNLHKAAIEEPLAPGNSGLVILVEDVTETRLP